VRFNLDVVEGDASPPAQDAHGRFHGRAAQDAHGRFHGRETEQKSRGERQPSGQTQKPYETKLRAADMNQGMPQNHYLVNLVNLVTAAPTTVSHTVRNAREPFVRKPIIQRILDRAIQITNIVDDLREYRQRVVVNFQYVREQDATVKRYTQELQRDLLRVFDYHGYDLSTEELAAITQSVLHKTLRLELYKLHEDAPTQQDLMEQILQDEVELCARARAQ
jgi:hypothetical protein